MRDSETPLRLLRGVFFGLRFGGCQAQESPSQSWASPTMGVSINSEPP